MVYLDGTFAAILLASTAAYVRPADLPGAAGVTSAICAITYLAAESLNRLTTPGGSHRLLLKLYLIWFMLVALSCLADLSGAAIDRLRGKGRA
jgi:hypothetical protein